MFLMGSVPGCGVEWSRVEWGGLLSRLTGVDQLEALARGIVVGEELQPEVVGGADESEAKHG